MGQITQQDYIDMLNDCMQKHDDYNSEIAKSNYMERGIEVYDIEGNKIMPPSQSIAFLSCNRTMWEIYSDKISWEE